MQSFAVMGNPIAHSQSPLIHELFARQTRQSISYSRILVGLTGLPQAVDQFQRKQGCGLNITSPFKHQAVALVDQLTPRAALSQTVNTIKFNADGRRFGDNTDGAGLIRDITINHAVSVQNKRILLLGAGGASHALLPDLLAALPSQIDIANRTLAKAVHLAQKYSANLPIAAFKLENIPAARYDLIINATNAAHLSLPDGILHSKSCCYDLGYSLNQSPFLLWADAQGAGLVLNGLGMLIEQAAESYYFWLKIRPNTKDVLSSLSQRYGEFEKTAKIPG
jgi:shikimate dehydrogenase